jgi:hypothetical protein
MMVALFVLGAIGIVMALGSAGGGAPAARAAGTRSATGGQRGVGGQFPHGAGGTEPRNFTQPFTAALYQNPAPPASTRVEPRRLERPWRLDLS